MALTKEERNALPEEHFAVPGKRKLPINDERHTRLAWDMVERTEGLSESERAEARRRILKRAKELGIDTADWNKVKAMAIEAMSLEVPEVKGHPNRMPFSGILVRLDEPSDKPPQGSGGRKVIMTTEAAKAALASLLGMGVNYTEKLDGHDPTKKIGLITGADIDAKQNALVIEGFIYASDFPDAAARIRADKRVLGFSFEAEDIESADPVADPLEITACVFTGAAILRKDKAAFSTTKLAATAEGQLLQDLKMNEEELKALIASSVSGALKPVTDRLEKIEAGGAGDPKKFQAKAEAERIVEPHAKALEACADNMEAAGIGAHHERGHAIIARKLARHLRASAAMGEIPHIYRDHDFFRASGEQPNGTDAVTKAVEAALKPLQDEIASQKTIIADMKAAAAKAAPAPDRKTIDPTVTALLAKGERPDADGKFTVGQVDALMDAMQLQGVDRIEHKTRLKAAGLIAA